MQDPSPRSRSGRDDSSASLQWLSQSFFQRRFPGPAQPYPASVLQHQHVIALRRRLHLAHPIQVHNPRPMHPEKLRRVELFLKDLHPLLAACPTVSGAAVLGDGRIVLLLNADELIQLVRSGAWRGAPQAEAAT